VLEVVLKLMQEPPGHFTTILGRDTCIVRERVEEPDLHGRCKKWLEIDLR
jgi:hypothetical protein